MWLLFATLVAASLQTIMLESGGNKWEMTYYLFSNSSGERWIQNNQYTSVAAFTDTDYTSIVCMSLTNNKTLEEGDHGVYFQLIEKLNTA